MRKVTTKTAPKCHKTKTNPEIKSDRQITHQMKQNKVEIKEPKAKPITQKNAK